jgi:hypothetical protein
MRRIGIRDLAYSIATYITVWQKNLSLEVDELKGRASLITLESMLSKQGVVELRGS